MSCIKKMGITALVHDIQPKNLMTFKPGNVGPVGEVNVRTRFRQSRAEMPWAIDPYWTGSRAHKLGSNVQDGYSFSFDSQGGPASTTLKGWNGNRSFKHQYGYSIHDVQASDLMYIPIDSQLKKFSYKQKVGRLRNVKAGSLFMPMGYTATGKPRGGLYPTSTAFGGITPASQAFDPEKAPEVELDPNGPKPTNALRAGVSNLGRSQRVGNIEAGQQLRNLRL